MTFGRQIGWGFVVMSSFLLVIGVVAVVALRNVVAAKDAVITNYSANLADAAFLSAAFERRVAVVRGYLLAPDDQFKQGRAESQDEFYRLFDTLVGRATTDEEKILLARIKTASDEQAAAGDKAIEARDLPGANVEAIALNFRNEIVPRNLTLRTAIADLIAAEHAIVEARSAQATRQAGSMRFLLLTATFTALVLKALFAWRLLHSVTQQVGSAVQSMESASNELQTAANQQATGAREQAAATTEIATTIRELLATARQIASSAQRVTAIAEETEKGATHGRKAIQLSRESAAEAQKQVAAIVDHMLELGRRSQQIGVILNVINDLADQTTILSINAAIEAAGVGETGKRFAVIADEIRKLSDRVGGSSKQIRELIDDVRGAVHTTIMVTETGSKAVDAGTQQFNEAAASFTQILSLVATTTDAAREIELSTKQQTTAVEQVNEAIGSVAQASRESEVSTTQTLNSVRDLTTLATNLNRFIQPRSQA